VKKQKLLVWKKKWCKNSKICGVKNGDVKNIGVKMQIF